MDPGEVPACLEGLTQIEEMLIARCCPIMTVYRKHGGQRGYTGHVLNLPQDIQQFLNKLPPPINELPILQISRQGANNTEATFRVRRDKIMQALLWLKTNNKYYHNIVIDMNNISCLPTNGIPEIRTVTVDATTTTSEATATEGPAPVQELGDEGNNEHYEHLFHASTTECAERRRCHSHYYCRTELAATKFLILYYT